MNIALQHTVLRLRAILLRGLRVLGAGGTRTLLQHGLRGLLRIDPVFVARDAAAFDHGARRAGLTSSLPQHQKALLELGGRVRLRRFCLCCNQTTPMLVDLEASWEADDGNGIPNWRECLVCSRCGMNSRQRLVAKLVEQAARERTGPRIYLMEQVTPIFQWVRRMAGADVQGSEYLGYQYRAATW